uniref:Sf126 n=1 Tax=Spodoptera frugiperda nuclear polyhedrosis virus TaxID=10455 RepID=E9L6C1_NPVSF|nr:hypothetical protein Sf126 [Spodoptera frugiperda multiple nucleopolyhedrovirus]AFH59070.1 hypothetical protein Sf126 [Spodoptera frugiperda multiple nucleopolyhedrovirus]QED40326.1 hypothetical protein [Spodoptera frugiperda multiple nucleopolyhedrovirus]QRN46239.1 Sf126 [Spodoptera frugiperda multiple nucleopolyhedrovirus]
MEFTTGDLLKNTSYSSKHYKRFDHYMTLINFCKGVISNNVHVDSVKQLEKLNLRVDPLTDYITNIFDYDMYIKDGNVDTIYVMKVEDKSIAGTISVDFTNDDIKFTVVTPTTSSSSSSSALPLQENTITIVKE